MILNGVPRSGKTAIARALQASGDRTWVNLGVDASMASTPESFRPGIGLRPGGERPDLENLVVTLYAALYESVAAHARLGLSVVVDVGHHNGYSQELYILRDCARRLAGLPVLFVGIQCPLEVIWWRRRETWGQDPESADDSLVAGVERWQVAVHADFSYDFEVDTSVLSPEQCAALVVARLREDPGTAFHALADEGLVR